MASKNRTLATAHPSRRSAFSACLLGGIVGLGIDLDHLAACLLQGEIPTIASWSCGNGRPLHLVALLGAAVFLGYRITHSYRLLVKHG